MPPLLDDSVLDTLLGAIDNGTALHICSGTPANRAAVLTNSLATVALSGGDYTIANGTIVDGRKVTVAAKAAVPVTATGTAGHYCIIDGSTLLARATVNAASPGLTSGSTVDIPAVIFEVGDPT